VFYGAAPFKVLMQKNAENEKKQEKKNKKFYTPDTSNLLKDFIKNRNRKMPCLAQQHFCPEPLHGVTVASLKSGADASPVNPKGVQSSDSKGNNSNILIVYNSRIITILVTIISGIVTNSNSNLIIVTILGVILIVTNVIVI
jgi:hypothetical protein